MPNKGIPVQSSHEPLTEDEKRGCGLLDRDRVIQIEWYLAIDDTVANLGIPQNRRFCVLIDSEVINGRN